LLYRTWSGPSGSRGEKEKTAVCRIKESKSAAVYLKKFKRKGKRVRERTREMQEVGNQDTMT